MERGAMNQYVILAIVVIVLIIVISVIMHPIVGGMTLVSFILIALLGGIF